MPQREVALAGLPYEVNACLLYKYCLSLVEISSKLLGLFTSVVGV